MRFLFLIMSSNKYSDANKENLTKVETKIIEILLNKGPKTNKQISEILKKDQGNISRKMNDLLDKRIVKLRKYNIGTRNFKEYSISGHFFKDDTTYINSSPNIEDTILNLHFLIQEEFLRSGYRIKSYTYQKKHLVLELEKDIELLEISLFWKHKIIGKLHG